MGVVMHLQELLEPGPPLRPRQVAIALGVSVTYVKDLVKAGVLGVSRLPNMGPGGPRYSRMLIRREGVVSIARDLKLLPELPQVPQVPHPNQDPRQAVSGEPNVETTR
jgi:hypothetical protein